MKTVPYYDFSEKLDWLIEGEDASTIEELKELLERVEDYPNDYFDILLDYSDIGEIWGDYSLEIDDWFRQNDFITEGNVGLTDLIHNSVCYWIEDKFREALVATREELPEGDNSLVVRVYDRNNELVKISALNEAVEHTTPAVIEALNEWPGATSVASPIHRLKGVAVLVDLETGHARVDLPNADSWEAIG
ncbi:hypothetical protein [Corynebacterium pyruviciproducens]|uniref:Uncharacterized protein n=1 Tax=Corynebacterium pyruviciproducens TaxID=598660 RepID=A0AAF0YZF0_9CORY|nr:hypothetical protein [Corynebacterium pyruviciproducens]WOT03390.1 hypothetical protein CYJ47_06455 [Corynebacterium pyruviciproducens]